MSARSKLILKLSMEKREEKKKSIVENSHGCVESLKPPPHRVPEEESLKEIYNLYDFFDMSPEVPIQKPIKWKLENDHNEEVTTLYFEPKELEPRSSKEDAIGDEEFLEKAGNVSYSELSLKDSTDGDIQISRSITPRSSKESDAMQCSGRENEDFLIGGGTAVNDSINISERSSNQSNSTKNNSEDKDFVVNSSDGTSETENTDPEEESDRNDELMIVTERLSERLKKQRKMYHNKKVCCKFCEEDISSRNFVRHLVRHHGIEKEVKDALGNPLKSKERRQAIELIKGAANFDLYLKGTVRPKKERDEPKQDDYYPCIYCKSLYSKRYLSRHAKICPIKNYSTQDSMNAKAITLSQTAIACALDTTDVISKLNIKEQVFNMMRGDEISLVVKKDLLIAHYGESYLKSQKRERKEYSCSNRMRELARLLIAYRTLINDNQVSFKDLLHPEKFDGVITATRNLAGFDPVNKTYQTPSIALHMGTALKVISNELIHLILKQSPGFSCDSPETSTNWRKDIKNFKHLVETRWNTEISSVANKDLNEKRWQKPLLVPLIKDVKEFRQKTLEYAEECEREFINNTDRDNTYKLLVYCTLSSLILFNRRRIGDVQYLKIADYQSDRKTSFADFESALSEGEKILTKKYKRVLNGGKGSRPVVILIPELLQKYINILLQYRHKYISPENQYVFAIPRSKIKWAQGNVAIRHLTDKMRLKNGAAISSNKLRKHIATTMQILNMTKSDCKQFSKFMGHTEKTHEEFYELPVDIYQTAKVVKLLLMMEKGVPTQHKGKSLSEIEIDVNECIDDENFQSTPTQSSFTENIPENIPSGSNNENQMSNNNLNYKRESSKIDFESETASDPKKAKTSRITKQPWSADEVAALKKHFHSVIQKGQYPSGDEIRRFIDLYKSPRTVPIIKSKLQHLRKQL